MPLFILIAIICLIAAEISVFIETGRGIGTLETVLLTFLTSGMGVLILRTQSGMSNKTLRQKLEKGESPISGIYDGVFILIAGVLLLLPGFITDAAGLLLLLPPVRKLIYKRHRAANQNSSGGTARTKMFYTEIRRDKSGTTTETDTTIEAEYKNVTEENPDDDNGGTQEKQ